MCLATVIPASDGSNKYGGSEIVATSKALSMVFGSLGNSDGTP